MLYFRFGLIAEVHAAVRALIGAEPQGLCHLPEKRFIALKQVEKSLAERVRRTAKGFWDSRQVLRIVYSSRKPYSSLVSR